MDLEDQGRIKAKVEEVGPSEVVVILGSPSVEAAEMYAETVTAGDPTYAGPLAGIALNLPVYYISEPEIKQQIPVEIYRDQVEMMEMVLPSEEIGARVKAVREKLVLP
jgi:glycine/sarcosine/betaine reductase complex component A